MPQVLHCTWDINFMSVWININRWQHDSCFPLYLFTSKDTVTSLRQLNKSALNFNEEACGHLQLVVGLCLKQLWNISFYSIRQNNHINPCCRAVWVFSGPFSTCTCAGLLSRSLSSRYHSSSAGVKVKDLLTWPPRINDCDVTRCDRVRMHVTL